MKKRCLYLLFAGIMFNSSCNSSKKEWEKLNQTTGFIREVSLDTKGKGSLLKSLDFIRDSLRLDTLENGYDGLQIRIWYGYSFTYRQQVIVIKNQGGTWSGNYYQFQPHYFKLSDSLLYFEKKMIIIKP